MCRIPLALMLCVLARFAFNRSLHDSWLNDLSFNISLIFPIPAVLTNDEFAREVPDAYLNRHIYLCESTLRQCCL